jgi:hypothetical protein
MKQNIVTVGLVAAGHFWSRNDGIQSGSIAPRRDEPNLADGHLSNLPDQELVLDPGSPASGGRCTCI